VNYWSVSVHVNVTMSLSVFYCKCECECEYEYGYQSDIISAYDCVSARVCECESMRVCTSFFAGSTLCNILRV